MATMRTDTSQVIATVGETYKVIQNHVLADLSDALLEVESGVEYIKGGSLNGGRIVYLVAKLPERTFKIEGDDSPIEQFLILRTGHDGLTSLTLGPTAIRLFCENQVNATIRGLKSKIVIRHTVNAERPIAEMRRALNFTGEYFDGLQKVFTELTKRPMTVDDVIKATVKLIPSTAVEPERALKAQAQRDLIVGLFQNSADLSGVGQNAYRFYQAVSAYADHERTYRKTKRGSAEDARATAILQGTALGIKDRALALVLPATTRRAAGGRFVSSQVPVSDN
jgi:phage/plasmid-like protein (TIGR03299 family)